MWHLRTIEESDKILFNRMLLDVLNNEVPSGKKPIIQLAINEDPHTLGYTYWYAIVLWWSPGNDSLNPSFTNGPL